MKRLVWLLLVAMMFAILPSGIAIAHSYSRGSRIVNFWWVSPPIRMESWNLAEPASQLQYVTSYHYINQSLRDVNYRKTSWERQLAFWDYHAKQTGVEYYVYGAHKWYDHGYWTILESSTSRYF